MRAARLVALCCSAAACLDAPPVSLPPSGVVDTGTGRDGARQVSGAVRLDDVSAALVAPAAVGELMLRLSSGDGFAAGDEVLVLQMTGAGAGHHETGIVAEVEGSVIALASALAASFPADNDEKTQVVRISQFTEVRVDEGGT